MRATRLLFFSLFSCAAACGGGSSSGAPDLLGDDDSDDAGATTGQDASIASGDDATTGTPPLPDGGSGDGAATTGDGGGPIVLLPRTGITADEMGVLVNDADPLSVSIAAYYVTARKIPAANVVHLTLPSSTTTTMTEAQFTPLKTQVDAAFAGTAVQAMAITWTHPYQVGEMSVTSAFALGYEEIASNNTCYDPNSEKESPYQSKLDSTSPFTDLGIRPAMVIPAVALADAQTIIDHGVASDSTYPHGSAYLMDTSDQTRSARCIMNATYPTNECQELLDEWDTAGSGIDAGIVDANDITGKTDIFLYVEGLASVPDLTTNTYLPGAVADHLTSFGGDIPTSGQMSCFQFLKAGATGSYGTVVEPCAYQQKFPDPRVLLPRYFGGATLIEAYWKSVAWPAEGIFIGEPLARPFGNGFITSFAGGTLTIETTTMQPGRTYVIEAADAATGPFTTVQGSLKVPKYTRATFTIPGANRAVYRFRDAT